MERERRVWGKTTAEAGSERALTGRRTSPSKWELGPGNLLNGVAIRLLLSRSWEVGGGGVGPGGGGHAREEKSQGRARKERGRQEEAQECGSVGGQWE